MANKIEKYWRVCPDCGYFKQPDAELETEYCARCGYHLQDQCKRCHLPFADPFANFCRRCGEIILFAGKKEKAERRKEGY